MGVVWVMWKTKDDEVHVEDALADVGGDTGSSQIAPTVFELFHTHAVSVEVTVNHMLEAVNKAADGKDASAEIQATIEAEHAADNLKAALRDKVGSREWKLLIGSDAFLHMLSRQDRIADYAQNVAEQLSFRELYDNDEARQILKELGDAVSATVARASDGASWRRGCGRRRGSCCGRRLCVQPRRG